MTLASLILLAVKLSITLCVFAVGLTASTSDLTYLFRNPTKLFSALLSMYVAMPLAAALLATAFDLQAPVRIALLAISLSPIPPFLPQKLLKAGGHHSYVCGLLVAMSLLAIVIVPVGLELLQFFSGTLLSVSPFSIARVVMTSVLLPLAAGIGVRYLSSKVADAAAKIVSIVSPILLLSLLPILVVQWPAFKSLAESGTLIAIVIFAMIGIIAGHLLGGNDKDNRSVLALATASRHPGVALAIAQTNFPDEKLVLPAVLLYMLISAVAGIPYQSWMRRKRTEVDVTALTPQQ